jgi:hypothetical protein
MEDRHLLSWRRALGEPAFAAAWAEGRALCLEEAVTDALFGGDPSSSATCPDSR